MISGLIENDSSETKRAGSAPSHPGLVLFTRIQSIPFESIQTPEGRAMMNPAFMRNSLSRKVFHDLETCSPRDDSCNLEDPVPETKEQ